MSQPSRVPPSLVFGPARLATAVVFATLALMVHGVAEGEAASITNRDAREYGLSIVTGSDTDDRVLKPNEALKDVCPKGCVIRFTGDTMDEYELDGSDVVSIEDGFFYYDSPENAASPAIPGVAKPPAK